MSLGLDALYTATLLPHYAYHRLVTDKYGPDTGEKLGGLPTKLRPNNNENNIWIHAVSVGETLAARPLVQNLKEAHPHLRPVITTTTATGREVAQKNFGAENVGYYPLDLSWMVKRAFDIIQPKLIILMELEIWPHFLAEAKARNIPVIVSNVRITDRSHKRFKFFGERATNILNHVDCWLSQNEEYANILRDLGVEQGKIHVIGSLKYDGLDFSDDPTATRQMHDSLGGKRLFVAGSTHAGEDEIIYDTFKALRAELGADLTLVLVPRHPERCDAVAALCPEEFTLHRRSQGDAPQGSDVILGDTMGELANMYRAAEVAFIGGTFKEEVGGHNMLEPAAFATPTVYGPHIWNFTEPAQILKECDGAICIEECSADALTSAIRPLLQDQESARKMGERARDAARSMQGATAATLEEIGKYLPPATE